MNPFEDLLKELGALLGSDLVPDEHSTCIILFTNGVKIQLELDKSSEFLIIGSLLGEVSPGRYREQILIEALKNNHLPEIGVFAFSIKKKALTLFIKKPFDELPANHLCELVRALSERALPWVTALKNQVIPSIPPTRSSSGPSIFNMSK